MGPGKSLVGQVLQETYRIEELIGQGGMGEVYEASHLRLDRRFAIKLLLPRVALHREALARFQREAKVTSALGHPHIVEVIDFNHTLEGTPYIVMELLRGEDLAARIRRLGQLALHQAASILRQTTSGLEAAHQQGVIHRDLKPQNVFLCRRGERDNFVKVVDFGMSKVLDSKSGLTRTYALLGTPYYMAPEQAEERASQVDERTDVYAMGAILFEMLAGRPPFTAEQVFALLYDIVRNQPPQLRELRPEVPRAVEQVISKALSKRPGDRQGSMAELSEAFREAAGLSTAEIDEPTEDRRIDWTQPAALLPQTEPAVAGDGRLSRLPTDEWNADPNDSVDLLLAPEDLVPEDAASFPETTSPFARTTEHEVESQPTSEWIAPQQASQAGAAAASSRSADPLTQSLAGPGNPGPMPGTGGSEFALSALAEGARRHALSAVSWGRIRPWQRILLSAAAVAAIVVLGAVALLGLGSEREKPPLAKEPSAKAKSGRATASAAPPEVSEPPPVHTTPSGGTVDASRPAGKSPVTVTVTANDPDLRCHAFVPRSGSQRQNVPCRFEASPGQRLQLWLIKAGYPPRTLDWIVRQSRSVAVRVSAASRRILLDGESGQELDRGGPPPRAAVSGSPKRRPPRAPTAPVPSAARVEDTDLMDWREATRLLGTSAKTATQAKTKKTERPTKRQLGNGLPDYE